MELSKPQQTTEPELINCTTLEEQRRFEILDAHWDLPVKDVDLEAR